MKHILKEEYGIEDISNYKENKNNGVRTHIPIRNKIFRNDERKIHKSRRKESLYYMGCYGIGVSRTLAALYEECLINDEKWGPCGFTLPESVAPFKVQIVPKIENEEKVKLANKLYEKLQQENIGAILDDREKITMGAKIKDCKVLGTPYMIVIGDKQEGDMLELENIKTRRKRGSNNRKMYRKI